MINSEDLLKEILEISDLDTCFSSGDMQNALELINEKVNEYFKQSQPTKSRGCCENCGEGYDNEEDWKYNTECEICGYPIPEHLIIRKND